MALLLNQMWPQHATIDQLHDANKLLGQCERKLHSPRLGNATVKNALKDFLGGAHVDLDTLPAALAGPALVMSGIYTIQTASWQ